MFLFVTIRTMVVSYVKQGFLLLTTVTLAASSSLRIIGGRDAYVGEFPYVVRLEIETEILIGDDVKASYSPVCTCSVLSTVWTLTAEHCAKQFLNADNAKKLKRTSPKQTYVIRYGSSAGRSSQNNYKVSTVLHSETLLTKRSLTNDDIGLLKTEPINLPTYGKISAVDFSTLYGHEVFTVGYGKTNLTNLFVDIKIDKDTFMNSSPLQVVKGMINKCGDDPYPSVCVVQACGRPTSMCTGDSGGPVIHPSGIVAVNSKGPIYINCRMGYSKYHSAEFGTVVPVSPYIDWIYDSISR